MNITEIETMLSMIANNRVKELTVYLLNERKKYYDEKEAEYIEKANSAFLNYMCNLATKPNYSIIDDKTYLDDEQSIFVINKKFEIGIDPCIVSASLKKLKRLKDLLENKRLVDNMYNELNYVVLQSEDTKYMFNSKYVDYLNAFMGEDKSIYIDLLNPIAHVESNRGEGIILGLKK